MEQIYTHTNMCGGANCHGVKRCVAEGNTFAGCAVTSGSMRILVLLVSALIPSLAFAQENEGDSLYRVRLLRVYHSAKQERIEKTIYDPEAHTTRREFEINAYYRLHDTLWRDCVEVSSDGDTTHSRLSYRYSDGQSLTSFEMRGQCWVLRERRELGLHGKVTASYTYDSAGVPERTSSIEYDRMGRRTAERWYDKGTLIQLTNYLYDGLGRSSDIMVYERTPHYGNTDVRRLLLADGSTVPARKETLYFSRKTTIAHDDSAATQTWEYLDVSLPSYHRTTMYFDRNGKKQTEISGGAVPSERAAIANGVTTRYWYDPNGTLRRTLTRSLNDRGYTEERYDWHGLLIHFTEEDIIDRQVEGKPPFVQRWTDSIKYDQHGNPILETDHLNGHLRVLKKTTYKY